MPLLLYIVALFVELGDLMKKINVVKSNRDFNSIISKNKSYKYKDYIIYLSKNASNVHRFGISVGKKVGNAVTRNKVKRQIRSIIDEKSYKNGFDCIIIVGKKILFRSFDEMKSNLHHAFKELDILEEKEK